MWLKKSVRVAFSFCLLLYFSAITLSIDFLHNHSDEDHICREAGKNGVCHHKAHISRDSSCWICAAHLQKEATEPTTGPEISSDSPLVRLLTENKAIGYVCERLTLLLRGPPAD